MVKKLVISLGFVLLMTFSLVVAGGDFFDYHPNVNVQAAPEQNLILRFKDADTGQFFKSVSERTSSGGSANTALETNSEKIDVIVYIVTELEDFLKPENILSQKEIGPFAADKSISINLQTNLFNTLELEISEPEEPEILINQTEEVISESESEVAEVVEEDTGSGIMTGLTIFKNEDGGFSSIWYVIIGIVFISGVVVFFVMRKKGATGNFGRSNFSNFDRPTVLDAETRIRKATQELIEARREINRLKSKDKDLLDAQEQFRKAKENLERIKRGGSSSGNFSEVNRGGSGGSNGGVGNRGSVGGGAGGSGREF